MRFFENYDFASSISVIWQMFENSHGEVDSDKRSHLTEGSDKDVRSVNKKLV